MTRILLFLLLIGLGCDSGGIANEALLAEGVVVEQDTGRPLPDIVVQIRDFGSVASVVMASDTTDADGRFRAYDSFVSDRRYRLQAVDLRLLEPGLDPEYYGLVTGGRVIDVERGRANTFRLEMELIQQD